MTRLKHAVQRWACKCSQKTFALGTANRCGEGGRTSSHHGRCTDAVFNLTRTQTHFRAFEGRFLEFLLPHSGWRFGCQRHRTHPWFFAPRILRPAPRTMQCTDVHRCTDWDQEQSFQIVRQPAWFVPSGCGPSSSLRRRQPQLHSEGSGSLEPQLPARSCLSCVRVRAPRAPGLSKRSA